MTENKIYANFKMRDFKGRRVSIFAQKYEDGLQIAAITCSKKDFFKKAYAREQFNKFIKGEPVDIHPYVERIPIHEHDGPVYTFNEWCKKNYKKVYENHVSVVGTQILDIHREAVKWNYSRLTIKTLL